VTTSRLEQEHLMTTVTKGLSFGFFFKEKLKPNRMKLKKQKQIKMVNTSRLILVLAHCGATTLYAGEI